MKNSHSGGLRLQYQLIAEFQLLATDCGTDLATSSHPLTLTLVLPEC